MDKKERSITVGLLGANHEVTQRIGEALGTPGQRSDLQFYNRLDTKIGVCALTIVIKIMLVIIIKTNFFVLFILTQLLNCLFLLCCSLFAGLQLFLVYQNFVH